MRVADSSAVEIAIIVALAITALWVLVFVIGSFLMRSDSGGTGPSEKLRRLIIRARKALAEMPFWPIP